jgi:hypothetical protein
LVQQRGSQVQPPPLHAPGPQVTSHAHALRQSSSGHAPSPLHVASHAPAPHWINPHDRAPLQSIVAVRLSSTRIAPRHESSAAHDTVSAAAASPCSVPLHDPGTEHTIAQLNAVPQSTFALQLSAASQSISHRTPTGHPHVTPHATWHTSPTQVPKHVVASHGSATSAASGVPLLPQPASAISTRTQRTAASY